MKFLRPSGFIAKVAFVELGDETLSPEELYQVCVEGGATSIMRNQLDGATGVWIQFPGSKPNIFTLRGLRERNAILRGRLI